MNAAFSFDLHQETILFSCGREYIRRNGLSRIRKGVFRTAFATNSWSQTSSTAQHSKEEAESLDNSYEQSWGARHSCGAIGGSEASGLQLLAVNWLSKLLLDWWDWLCTQVRSLSYLFEISSFSPTTFIWQICETFQVLQRLTLLWIRSSVEASKSRSALTSILLPYFDESRRDRERRICMYLHTIEFRFCWVSYCSLIEETTNPQISSCGSIRK